MLAADYVIDMGPKAGRLGGEVVFAGTPQEMLNTDTMTSQYLNGKMKIEIPAKRRKGNGKSIWLKGAKGNNLKNVDVEFPWQTHKQVTDIRKHTGISRRIGAWRTSQR